MLMFDREDCYANRKNGAAKHGLALLVAVACWGYLLLLAALIVFLRTLGDHIIPATVLLFSPRWFWLLPIGFLSPAALLLHRRSLIPLLFAVIVGVFPLMGFCVGWRRLLPADVSAMPLRVMAFNVHHLDLRDPDVVQFVAAQHPDVIALEELPSYFNRQIFPDVGWHWSLQNELLLASRYPIISSDTIWEGVAARFVVATPQGAVEVAVVHLSSPHYALRDAVKATPSGADELSQNIGNRAFEAATLSQAAKDAKGPFIIAGDFNLTSDSPLFAGNFAGMTDAFESTGLGLGWTYQDKWTSVRIDHVLTNDRFRISAFLVGPNLGSPHRPIVADLRLATPGAAE